jgi:hypothetical protein
MRWKRATHCNATHLHERGNRLSFFDIKKKRKEERKREKERERKRGEDQGWTH